MNKIRIGIVEDDLFSSTLLQQELNSMDYDVLEPCTDYMQAVAMLDTDTPDLVILDINLAGEKNGIELAGYIRKNLNIPFIFLTGKDDKDTLDQAKLVKPSAFLVKPFKQADLHAAIELAVNNFNFKDKKSLQPLAEENKGLSDIIFIKDGEYFYKVKFDDIDLLSSDNVYVIVHTSQKKFMVRASLNEYIEKFDASKFIRVHQRYAVNINKIDRINSEDLIINKQEIPISKSYKSALMKKLNLD